MSGRLVNRELPQQSTLHNRRSKRDVVVLELLFFGERRFLCGRTLLLGAAVLLRSALLGGRATARGGVLVVPATTSTSASAALVVSAATTTAAAFTATAVAAADELEVLDHDGQLAALPAALLVLPGVELEPAFDEDRLALLEVLVDDLGLLPERGHVDKRDFFLVLAVGGSKLTVAGDAELDDGRLARQVFQLRVARQVSHQQDLVEAGHDALNSQVAERGTSAAASRARDSD